MPSGNKNSPDINAKFLHLSQRGDKAREQTIRLKQQLESAEIELKKAEAEAVEKFGTSDLEKLRGIFREMRDKNIAALSSFEEGLEASEKLITETHNKLSALEGN